MLWTAAALLAARGPAGAGSVQPGMDVRALIERIGQFEAEVSVGTDAEKRAVLSAFAEEMLHRRITVHGGVVMAVYERGNDWQTRPYFGFDYDEAHHVRLVDLDPAFHRQLASHRQWVSVACTYADRQLIFELAVDAATHAGLQTGQSVDLTVEVAGIIRGKTVYGREIGKAAGEG